MINTLKNIFKIKFATSSNTFIYYFKRIWLLGKILPDRIYADSSLKTVISCFIFALIQIYRIFTKFLYVGLAVFLPVLLMNEEANVNIFGFETFVHIIFCMSCILVGTSDSEIFKDTTEKYIAIKYFRMNPKHYVQSSLLFKYVLHFTYMLPAILVFSMAFLKASFIEAFSLFVLMVSFRFMLEAFNLYLYDKKKIVLIRKVGIVWILIGIMSVAAYLPLLTKTIMPTMNIVFSLPFMAIAIIMGFLSFYYIMFGYKNYSSTVRKSMDMNYSYKAMVEKSKSAKFQDVSMKDKDINEKSLLEGKFNNLKGYNYLNAIFFDRHRRQIVKPVLIRIAIILAILLALIITFSFIPFDSLEKKLSPFTLMPMCVFMMYCLSIGDKACRAMFYNCDISLLRYGFYRKRNVILKNFNIRLVKISLANLAVGAAFALSALGFMFFVGERPEVIEIAGFTATILILSVFFTVHHLFMYYVFQPYTTELDVKNPFFKIINMVVYMLCYICLQIDDPSIIFTYIVLIVTVIYIIVALILINRFSPKTFRVK